MDRSDPPVGRERELDAIDRFAASHGTLPAALLIEGPPGQGKTTLWSEALRRMAGSGYTVISCRPSDVEVGLQYGGLTDLLASRVAPVLGRLPEPQRRAVEIALLLAPPGGTRADPRAVAAGTLGVMRELAAAGPLVIGVDDAQWLDAASTMVLGYAARRLGSLPIAYVAARRTAGPASLARVPLDSDPRGLDLTVFGDERLRRLALGPLSVGAIHRMLHTQLGISVPRPLLRRIHDASGGNPFYALEIARGMREQAATWTAGDPIALSATLGDLLAGRFAALDPRVQDALFVAAVASTPTLELLERVAGVSAADFTAAQRAGIVRSSAGQIEFVHPLLAAVAAAGPSEAARRAWHARLAESEDDLVARAGHLALARPGPDIEVARTIHEAAAHAASRGAPSAAGELFAAAIQRVPEGMVELRAEWALEAIPIMRQAGDLRAARALAERTVADLPGGGLRSDALIALSGLVGSDPGGDALELQLIMEAEATAADDPSRRAAALLGREMWERHRDRLEEALPIARAALALAEQTADRHLLAAALTRTADLEVLLGEAAEPVAHFERALVAGRGLHMDAYADSAPAMLAACLIRHGRMAEAHQLLLPDREDALARGDDASLQTIYLFLGELEWLRGDLPAARAYAGEGLLVSEQSEARVLQGATGAVLALVDATEGAIESARTGATRALAVSEEVGDRSYAVYARQVLAHLDLSLGDARSALAHLEPLDETHGLEGTKRISFIGDRIECMIGIGGLDGAELLTEMLARRGRKLKRAPLLATAARCRALLIGARGDTERAIAAAEEAVRLANAQTIVLDRGRALLALGDILRRSKRRAAARQVLEQAMTTFTQIGATVWSDRAGDSLARVGGRVRSQGLTPTEEQVAVLVARGMTNREIAAELYVTVRAVEANLTRIYAKLGIRSRTELAKLI